MVDDLPVIHLEPFAMVSSTRKSCYVLIAELRFEVGRWRDLGA
jgi:hypothetical protein